MRIEFWNLRLGTDDCGVRGGSGPRESSTDQVLPLTPLETLSPGRWRAGFWAHLVLSCSPKDQARL